MTDYLHIPAVVHVHTTRSGGTMTIEQLGGEARERGVEAIVLTDKLRSDWFFGMKPFEGVLKVKVPGEYLTQNDIEEYIADVNAADAAFDDVLIVPGFEIAPSHRWSGSPREGNLKLHDWNKEILAFGIKEPQDWAGVSAAAGWTEGGRGPASWLEMTVAIALAATAAALFFKKKIKVTRLGAGCRRGMKISRVVHPFRALGAVVMGIAALVFAAFYPFSEQSNRQYEKSAGAERHQSLIDYVESAGGIAAWAHPEAQWERRYDAKEAGAGAILSAISSKLNFTAVAYAESHQELLKETFGFTAFAALYEGYHKTARPGGIWDSALVDYSLGDRKEPFWALGEVDYYGSETNKELDSVLTVIQAEEFNSESMLEAMKAGRMYVTTTTPEGSLRMPVFTASSDGGEVAGAGETLTSGGHVLVSAVIDSVPAQGLEVVASVVINGVVAQTYKGTTPLRVEHEAKIGTGRGNEYVRVEVNGTRGVKLISNPIFISRN